MNSENRRTFIAKLANENRDFYGTSDGRGILHTFELSFEHRWNYLFELIQNAIDARAHSIAFRLTEDGDALTFQHDGNRSLGEKEVKGLSKAFRSTKGASTVGFMGIGFKSVFRRFQEARISGWGWTFRYEVTSVVGEEYGDVQRDWLGAVVPIWDDAITAPELGFTTRFEMRRRADHGTDLKSDLAHFLSDDARTPLAILASSGLRRLEADGQVWELDVSKKSDGSLEEAVARSGGENWIWRLFPVQFTPSREAIARFLEHRRIQPSEHEREQVYADAARPRQVLGVLPLDDDGTPKPPTKGRVYATLPTDVTLPFGLHVNADWLLNISRNGLKEIEDNPWQREIVDQIADVLASFLGWVARTCSEPVAAKAAFAALAPPSPEEDGLEALLAEGRWLSRLRTRLEDAAVLPVWTEETDALVYAKPSDAVLPPPPLAKAFQEQPALRPAVLLKAPVLMDEVLGSGACDLLCQTSLLVEMSPRDLERVWPDGLASWWTALADEQERRRSLLFRIWAAVAELADEDAWRDVDLPCIRTAAGQWLPVSEVVFFGEPFPSQREPGGDQAHQLMLPFIPETNRLRSEWISELQSGAAKENSWKETPLSQALKWIKDHARHISLREVVEDAVNALVSSPTTDLSVLTPLGHWAKHRNRPGLLTRVLVESNNGLKGIPVGEALLADPYVDHHQGRRRLFPTKSAISATYLAQDPKNADAREWRTFFEKAGIKGKLKVKPVEDNRQEREHVAQFLGLEVDEIGKSNSSGYELLDFDIEADLPGPDAPEEVRAALATWLTDGYIDLIAKGRRQAWYFYYRRRHDLTGSAPSAWVTKLSELAWVPCDIGGLRRPQDVLPWSDPTREGAPVAKLSSELQRVLEQEGVIFGTAIPEATSLCKLSTTGSRLGPVELAQLLRECREQITTDEDRHHLKQVLQTLTVPAGKEQRVPLHRIVQRVGGGGGRRGALGGWTVPLDRIVEALRAELKHADFPCEFPDTTTGEQALAYLRGIWQRARSSPERLANEVRDVLPDAYAYCLEDCAEDASLSERWQAAVPEAAVFAEREWVVLTETDDIYFDDSNDRRFLPENMQLQTVTSGHLGNSRSKQLRTAEALRLQLLWSCIEREWHGEDETLPVADDWVSRFDLVCQLLRRVRSNERTEGDGTGAETERRLRLIHVRQLALDVSLGNAPAERVPVNARLSDGVLTLAGRPVQFGADAAKELLHHFSFGQRGGLAADLTGMLGAIDNPSDFNLAADKFRRSFARDFELPPMFQREADTEQEAGSGDGPTRTADGIEPMASRQPGADNPSRQAPFSGDSEHGKSHPPGGASATGVQAGKPNDSGHDEPDSTGGSFTKDRALAQQNALVEKLRSSLKGEIAPNDNDSSEATNGDGNSGADLGDEEYRRAAMQYEKESGRVPELGDPNQTGWDIRSVDPKTGAVRLIEVKGKGCAWVDDEVVELSRAQVRKAFKASVDQTEAWHLYVVEKTADGGYQVLPVGNPVHMAAKWILCGEPWRVVAETKSVRIPHNRAGIAK